MPRALLIRRGRRTDLPALLRLLAAAGMPLPPPDRVALHRFRRLVADLGSDLYLAVREGDVVGLVHVTYARQLVRRPVARIECLLVAPGARRQGVGSALLAWAARRALGRGCGTLSWTLPADAADAQRLATRGGLSPAGVAVARALDPPARPGS